MAAMAAMADKAAGTSYNSLSFFTRIVMSSHNFVSTPAELDALYGAPSDSAKRKAIDHLDSLCKRFISAAPFMLLATAGSDGLDCSPRGDQRGFVEVSDDHTLLLPDRRGNNRIDSLRNIVHDPRVGLLFLIPGVHQCLRVNGRARISIEPLLLQRFALDDVLPKSVIVITVEQAFAQCARAIQRAQLWAADLSSEFNSDCNIDALPGSHTDGLDQSQ